MTTRPWPRMLDVAIAAAFVAAIATPGLLMVIDPPTGKETALTGDVHPALADLLDDADGPRDTLHALGTWFRTRYGLRDRLIEADALLEVGVLHQSTSSQIILGDDGWLFYTGEDDLDSFRHARPFTPAQLDRWRTIVDGWVAVCHRARLVVLIAPDKATLYPDEMPAWTAPVTPRSRLDQLADVLARRTDIVFVDVRPLLAAQRAAGLPVFYRTDSHWNELAGYLATRQIAQRLGVAMPVPAATVEPLATGGDLARILGLRRWLDDEEVRLALPPARATIEAEQRDRSWRVRAPLTRDMPYETLVRSQAPGAPLGRLYVRRDSFGYAMEKPLAELFAAATFRWSARFETAELVATHPDVVIVEIAERHLMNDPEQFATN